MSWDNPLHFSCFPVASFEPVVSFESLLDFFDPESQQKLDFRLSVFISKGVGGAIASRCYIFLCQPNIMASDFQAVVLRMLTTNVNINPDPFLPSKNGIVAARARRTVVMRATSAIKISLLLCFRACSFSSADCSDNRSCWDLLLTKASWKRNRDFYHD